jgi:hypothetical protein
VVCNAGFTGSDVFEATTGRLVGLSGLFAHPLGRNAFAVALKKLARQVGFITLADSACRWTRFLTLCPIARRTRRSC